MKTSLFTTSLTAMNLQEAIRTTAEVGYDAIEIMCAPPHLTLEMAESRCDEVCSWLKTVGLPVSALSLIVEYTSSDERVWLANVDETCRFIRLCERFGTRTVKTMPGRPGGKQATAKHWDQFRRAMDIITPVASSEGVLLAVETHLNHLSDSIEGALRCLTYANSESVGVNLDFCNVRTCHEDPMNAIKQFRGRIFFTHVKDSLFTVQSGEYVRMGEGKMKYGPILEGLREMGYNGYVSVECLYRSAKQDDPRGSVAHDLKVLRELLAGTDSTQRCSGPRRHNG